MHVRDITDMEPHSEGFFNRGAESINIIGNVIGDLLNGFGRAISGATNSIATNPQNNTQSRLLERNPNNIALSRLARSRLVDKTVVDRQNNFVDAERIDDFISDGR